MKSCALTGFQLTRLALEFPDQKAQVPLCSDLYGQTHEAEDPRQYGLLG